MSLLVVRDEVDVLGQPVNVFLVLATVDSSSHLDALANLSDILSERKICRCFVWEIKRRFWIFSGDIENPAGHFHCLYPFNRRLYRESKVRR
jgi:hypothetical protein